MMLSGDELWILSHVEQQMNRNTKTHRVNKQDLDLINVQQHSCTVIYTGT